MFVRVAIVKTFLYEILRINHRSDVVSMKFNNNNILYFTINNL